ncbi:MAG: carbamoyltransferase [Deltaproteobacteria bacterium]|nr:carbamoyltransferase [Deltaproteobacteria bacterium]
MMKTDTGATILGINCFGHDTAAALVRGGEITEHHEQERYNRLKHTLKYPYEAIGQALARAGITAEQIDAVAYPFRCDDAMDALLDDPTGPLAVLAGRKRDEERHRLADLRVKARIFGEHFGVDRPAYFVGHHESHAASVFFSSPFDRAAILTLDGGGDLLTSMTAIGDGARIEVLHRGGYLPHGIGLLYSAVTRWLGFQVNHDEGKVMGLAPYGKPAFRDAFRKIVDIDAEGDAILNLDYFCHHTDHIMTVSPGLEELLGPRRGRKDPIEDRHRDVAFSLQERTEELLFARLCRLYEKTRCDNLCLAGGTALNSVANGKIARNTPFRRVFIPPFVHDSGTAIGAAQWVAHHEFGAPRVRHGHLAALGRSFDMPFVERRLRLFRLPYRVVADPAKTAAELLAAGKFVGWFQGRAESGPRALGYRSILADPRGSDAKRDLNAHVKFREAFRPYAPAILAERFEEYFEATGEEPYMLQVHPVREEKRDEIPAVTHVDGSGRVQTVARDANPRFHALIDRFAQLTGVPVVLNTSFNVMGEPIVDSVEDAIRCFYTCGLDALVIENALIVKDSAQLSGC